MCHRPIHTDKCVIDRYILINVSYTNNYWQLYYIYKPRHSDKSVAGQEEGAAVDASLSDVPLHEDNTIPAPSSMAIVHSHKGLKLAHLNIRSLPRNLDQLRILLHNKPIDVLSLNETFLTDDIFDDDVSIPGYLIYRNDRGSRHGGGVAFYVIDNLSNTEIIAVDTSTCTTMPTDVECVCVLVLRDLIIDHLQWDQCTDHQARTRHTMNQ